MSKKNLLTHDTAYDKTKRSLQKKGLTFKEERVTTPDGDELAVIISTDRRMPRLRAAFRADGSMVSMDS